MSKRKIQSKVSKALTVSIHGIGIDIDASFSNASKVTDIIGDITARVADTFRVPGAPPAGIDASANQNAENVVHMVAELAKTIRPEQIEHIGKQLDPAQKMFLFEIMNMVAPDITRTAPVNTAVDPVETQANAPS